MKQAPPELVTCPRLVCQHAGYVCLAWHEAAVWTIQITVQPHSLQQGMKEVKQWEGVKKV